MGRVVVKRLSMWMASGGVLLALVLTPMVANAESMAACKADKKKFCRALKSPRPILRCLLANEANLSDGCKKALKQRKQEMDDVYDACRDDSAKFCKHMRPGVGRLLRCLRSHKDEVSKQCKAALDKVPKKKPAG